MLRFLTRDLLRPEQISAKEAQQILSREMLSYLAESKRMDITRMRTVLGVEPDYADLDQGLSDCVTSEKRSERNGTDLSSKRPLP